jgi:hypothetical protein
MRCLFACLAALFLTAHLPNLALAKNKTVIHQSSTAIEYVPATFVIQNPVIHVNEPLRVRLTFRNEASRPVIYHYLNLLEHAWIFFADGTPVKLADHASFTDAPAFTIRVEPHQTGVITEKLDMFGWYDLNPGTYKIRFFYPISLLPKEHASIRDSPSAPYKGLLPWDNKSYKFKIIR